MTDNVITLDYIRAKADAEYAPYKIEIDGEVLTLRNPVRLPREQRSEVLKAVNELKDMKELVEEAEDDAEAEEMQEKFHGLMLEVLHKSADNEKLADVLNEELRNDFGMTQILFFDWFGADEVGEASNSPAE